MSPVFPGFNTVDLHFADAELLGQIAHRLVAKVLQGVLDAHFHRSGKGAQSAAKHATDTSSASATA